MNAWFRKAPSALPSISRASRTNWREIVQICVQSRSALYWHSDGVVEAATAAAEAAEPCGMEAAIDAIECEVTAHEFICDFDDPCDIMWPAQ